MLRLLTDFSVRSGDISVFVSRVLLRMVSEPSPHKLIFPTQINLTMQLKDSLIILH